MAASHYPTTQYLAGNFVISAGSVLFRRVQPIPVSASQSQTSASTFEICILHQLTKDEWLLPKGRKDRGETLEQAAVRETYEETSYPCHLWPQRMPTRAPAPGVSNIHRTQIVDDITEPLAVTVRELGNGRTKLIFWYIALAEEGAEKVVGSQMEDENFESHFVDAATALRRLTFQGDRDIVQQAIDIVIGSSSISEENLSRSY